MIRNILLILEGFTNFRLGISCNFEKSCDLDVFTKKRKQNLIYTSATITCVWSYIIICLLPDIICTVNLNNENLICNT